MATIATRADPQHEYLHVLSHRFPGKEDARDQRITEFNKKSMFLLKSCKDMSVSLCVCLCLGKALFLGELGINTLMLLKCA